MLPVEDKIPFCLGPALRDGDEFLGEIREAEWDASDFWLGGLLGGGEESLFSGFVSPVEDTEVQV